MKTIFNKSWHVLFIRPGNKRTFKDFDFYEDIIIYINSIKDPINIKIYRVKDNMNEIILYSEYKIN